MAELNEKDLNEVSGGQGGSLISYTIQWGDTLSELAFRFNTTVPYLCQINGISNPDLIKAETVIKVPAW